MTSLGIFSLTNLVEWLIDSSDGNRRQQLMEANEEIKEMDNEIDRFVAILDKVVPQLPSNPSACVKGPNTRDKWIDKVLNHLFHLIYFHHLNHRTPPEALASVVERVICRASDRLFLKEGYFTGNTFLSMLVYYLKPNNDTMTKIFINTFITLMNRMPDAVRTEILRPRIALQVMDITKRLYSVDIFQKLALRKCYDKFNMENVIKTRFPSWSLICEASSKFKMGDLAKALELLVDVVRHNSFCVLQLIMSSFLDFLRDTLIKVDKYRKNGISEFLRVFLNLSGDQTLPNINDFKKLVDHLISAIDYMTCLLKEKLKHIDVAPDKVQDVIGENNSIILVLDLLQCLYILNSSWYQWFDIVSAPPLLSKEAFFSNNLIAMAEQKKYTKYIVWIDFATKSCPAILPLHLRTKILRNFLGSISDDDTKITICVGRNNLFKNVYLIFQKFPERVYQRWSFRFKDEIGIGAGPTKELYSLMSREFQRHDLGMWNGEATEAGDGRLYTCSAGGLYPKVDGTPRNSSDWFKFLGVVMAKAIFEGQHMDIPLSEEFFRCLMGDKFGHLRRKYYEIPAMYPTTKQLLEQLLWVKRQINLIMSNPSFSKDEKKDKIKSLTFQDGNSFKDLYINFTKPGSDEELIKGGHDIILSPLNLERYLEALCAQKSLVVYKCEAVRNGLNSIIPIEELSLITPEELRTYCCGEEAKEWSVTYLQENCAYDGGYTMDSEPVIFLFQVMSSLNFHEKRMFLQFVTSSSTLPIEGLTSLKPRLTVSKMTNNHTRLPCASTCFNMIHIPPYESVEVTREKLLYAIREGINSFEFC